MSAGLLHLLVGSLGIAFATLILRADPKRWDNRAFATLGYIDAFMAIFRGVAASSGADIADRSVMIPCAGLAPLLAWASIEFAYSFPFSRRLPWRWRAPLVAATALAVMAMWGSLEFKAVGLIVNVAFFIPASVIMMVLLVRNLRRVEGDRVGVRLVVIALALRWITANILYSLHSTVDHDTWALMLWVESTLITLIAFVLIGLAVLRSNLFTMRGAMGDLALEGAFFLSGLLLTAAAIEGALKLTEVWPRVGRPLVMVASLVPMLVYVVARRVRPTLEAGLDPRRALRREVLDRVLQPTDEPGDPEATAAVACRTLVEVNAGGEARFVRDEVPAAALDRVVAPVRRGADESWGALVVTGGILDRETAAAATSLADLVRRAFEHRRLIGELEESRRLAALGSFAAAIAHDIRTPLTSVQMNVQILRGKVTLPPDDMEYFDIALDELQRLEGHVKELLDYAKPLQLHRETVTVQELADDAARTIEPILAERGQALRTAHGPGVPAVSIDSRRLRQVIWNLLDNAAKASPSGATIELRTRADGGRVAIDVVDTGAGIAPGDLGRIFEPFFTTRPDGTGLGLAICQKVVRAHAGEIQVQSVPAAGSTFTVLLPA